MSKQIRWGIMGAGRIAGWFSEGLTVAEGAVRYAVASRTLEKGVAFAETYGYEKAYGSYKELLQDEKVDVVYVATPVREHYACVKACLDAGKHVLCEKALTVNSQQAGELISLAREKKLCLMEAMWTKCQPVFRQIRKWVADGVLGDIQAVDIRFYTAAWKNHRLYKHELAGGALLDLGYYPVTVACSLLGNQPEKIFSHSVIGSSHVDLLDSIVLEYENGKFAHLSCGLGSEKMVSLYILGTKGRITMQQEFFFQATKAEVLDFDNEVLASFSGPFLKNGYEFEAIEVMECLNQGKTESETVRQDDSFAVMRILDECRRQAGFRFEFE